MERGKELKQNEERQQKRGKDGRTWKQKKEGKGRK